MDTEQQQFISRHQINAHGLHGVIITVGSYVLFLQQRLAPRAPNDNK